MKTAVIPILMLATVAWPACSKKSPDKKDNAASPAPKTSRPMTPKANTCAKDADCALTYYRHGNCCIGCGIERGVPRARAAALATWHRKSCNQGGYACPKVKCRHPKGKPVAKCKANRCTAVWVQPRHNGIQKDGRFVSPRKLPPRYPCKKNADCAMTRAQPGTCCPTRCPSGRVGGTVAWVKALEQLRARRCGPWLKANPHACSRVKCYPKGRPEPRCDKGRCLVHYKPLR